MSARTKVIIAIFIIVLSVFIIFFLKLKKSEKTAAKLTLVSASKTVTVGQDFKFSLFFKSQDRDISSFDAVVSYDPEVVRIDEITTSNIFPVYTRKLIEDFKSRFIITGVQTDLKNRLLVSEGELAEITATPLKAGKAVFGFIIEGRKYTNMVKSNLENIPFSSNTLEIPIAE